MRNNILGGNTMGLFNSRELKRLEHENEKLRAETVRLTKEICALDLKLFRTYGEEMVEKLSTELGLTEVQIAKLRFMFSIEHCRVCGVPEDRIVHSREEFEKVFMVGEI
jgi:hypothetical protein